ncbi:hypothetical protein AB3R30_09355 [Leptolyngbyaceae cyanobacterium UHCC 1019]
MPHSDTAAVQTIDLLSIQALRGQPFCIKLQSHWAAFLAQQHFVYHR